MMKAWLILLVAVAGLTGMASVLSGNDHGAVTSANPRPTPVNSRDEDHWARVPMMRGREMMDGMMDGCSMMNRDRPNNQWRSAT